MTIHHPSLVIRAEGPSFQVPVAHFGRRLSKIGFSNVASCIEIQVEGPELPATEQLAQMAIYARQIFIHQPNRRFVRVLFVTGRRLRLFHFDRSGAQYTPPMDIDKDPKIFVRLIIGLSSPKESDLGLDSSIQWKIENGRKVGGTLTARGTNDAELIYPLLSVDPFFRRTDIRGRCTTCWRVSDPVNGEELLVKDSSRTFDGIPEVVHLQEALGIPGVVQMVTCDLDSGQTKELRGFTVVPATFVNRVATRIVMKRCGDSIVRFASAKQLLCALRDAIAGHKEIFKKGSLHRDVSIQNVVLGKPGAEEGEMGILIDFDMATRRGEDGCHPPANWQIGIPLYQSRAVLSSKHLPRILPHDHLDDLESFLYILTHILYAYDRHGVLHQVDEMLTSWDRCDTYFAPYHKESFLTLPVDPHSVSERWPEALLDVLRDFKAFLLPFSDDKVNIMKGRCKDGPEILEAMKLNAESHYDEVIRLFNIGIAALKDEDDENPLHESPLPSRKASQPMARLNPSKRRSDDYPDSQPVAKRLNFASCLSPDSESSDSSVERRADKLPVRNLPARHVDVSSSSSDSDSSDSSVERRANKPLIPRFPAGRLNVATSSSSSDSSSSDS
ncbi:hypothetical protein MD484_g8405, partial [Candolleomyces efflorescens]